MFSCKGKKDHKGSKVDMNLFELFHALQHWIYPQLLVESLMVMCQTFSSLLHPLSLSSNCWAPKENLDHDALFVQILLSLQFSHFCCSLFYVQLRNIILIVIRDILQGLVRVFDVLQVGGWVFGCLGGWLVHDHGHGHDPLWSIRQTRINWN